MYHGSINTLRLVYPPISNQEADWLSESDSFRKYVSSSKIYMIGHREEIQFKNLRHEDRDEKSYLIFDLVGHTKLEKDVALGIEQFWDDVGEKMDVLNGPKVLKLKGPKAMVEYTVESLLFYYSRGDLKLEISKNYKNLLNFDLLYVGISKGKNSFTRLMDQKHKAREKILSNEGQKKPTARLTDEIFIFLFDIDDLQIKVLDHEDELDRFLDTAPLEKKLLVADAEKAFVHILKTKYNKVSYRNYPKCLDGLAGQGLNRYGYVISENISFNAGGMVFRGAYNEAFGWIDPACSDMVAISGDNVMVINQETKEEDLPEETILEEGKGEV